MARAPSWRQGEIRGPFDDLEAADMRMHRSLCCGAAIAALLLTAGLTTPGSGAVGATPPERERGGPGSWTQISTGASGISNQAGLYRTSDGVLHVVYPKGSGSADDLGHVAISPTGSVALQNDVLGSPWAAMDSAPALVGGVGGGLRVVFGGIRSVDPGFWSDGRMYTATAPGSGAAWTLPAEAVGISHSAYGSYGTAATTLADGTPIAAWPLNSDVTWHVGTGADPDQTFALGVPGAYAYDMAMVRDGGNVWIGWYANGSTPDSNGTFVRQIYPTLGPILKAPGSSVGVDSVATGRVALVARTGGGVYAAYCLGYPTCASVGLWQVGSGKVTKVPGSRYATRIAASPGPSGRIWVSWADNIPRIRAVRTGRSGAGLGPVRTVGMPRGKAAVYSVAIEGTTGRGDIVIQVGDGFWHTQVVSGLTLKAKPTAWKHGKKRTVAFTVLDAGNAVAGAKVKVGARHCTTKASGKCVIKFAKSTKRGRLVARASHSGYAGAVLRLKVR